MSDNPITIGSAHLDLPASFREEAAQRIRDAAAKYLGDLIMASVHLGREGADIRCSVIMQLGAHAPMTGEATAPDIRLAFQAALDKVEKQMRRTKRFEREDRAHRPDKIATA